MSQLNWEQLAGVNLEYRLYPFEYFLAAQQRLEIGRASCRERV